MLDLYLGNYLGLATQGTLQKTSYCYFPKQYNLSKYIHPQLAIAATPHQRRIFPADGDH